MISSTIQLISESTSQQGYITLQLWKALSEDIMDKQPLTQVAVWAIGEYGDLLLVATLEDNSETVRPSEDDVISIYHKLLWSPQNSPTTKQYALMSLTKLSTRFINTNRYDYVPFTLSLLMVLFSDSLISCRIQQIVSSFASNLHIELQQRGVEFSQLFGKYSNLRPALLERMPPIEVVRTNDVQTNGDIEQSDTPLDDSPQHVNSDSVNMTNLLHLHLAIIFKIVRFLECTVRLIGWYRSIRYGTNKSTNTTTHIK